MEHYLEQMRKETQLRKERLKTIKELVQRGEYRVNSEKVAAKLIEEALKYIDY
ncbi:MAG: flagellar biosynthesis anti-sigma factor FlgM [Deltaproteobacteria bacterium]|jgi:anti-sigma28 factor (negative regulator of flagellin synthesis)|nr:flagellar biosynthesis anti-sigma factor FlgM [Deltaproteobacteria bacterium]